MSPTSKGAKKFADYASSIFVAYILRLLEEVSKLDVVWDRYMYDPKRGSIGRVNVTGTSPLSANWADFLCVDDNQTDLFQFLPEHILLKLPHLGVKYW